MPPKGATENTTRLRRIALDRQGLLRRAPFGTGLAGTRRAVERLGSVQIDTISVVSRAHDHVLQVRVPGYRSDMLHRLQADGSVFEYWAHAAAYLPMRDYRFALPRMRDMRERRERWIRSRDRKLMRQVLDRVRLDGPLQARDFEDPGHRSSGWWDWKPAKRALEQLFMEGELMVVGRSGFQKIYDLTERVLPEGVDTREPTLEDYATHLVERHLDAHGFASSRACAYQRRTAGLHQALAQRLEEATAAGDVVAVPVPGPERRVYADPEALERRMPAAPPQVRLLSPFDNAILLRHRTLSLFGFDYQLESYRPAGKRRFGYFCLPMLYRDRLIGRADCKAYRAQQRLEVKSLFIERERELDGPADVIGSLMARALERLAAWNDCGTVTLGTVEPAHWWPPLNRALATVRRDGRELQSTHDVATPPETIS